MNVTFTGQWKQAEKILSNLEKRYERAVKRALARAGIYLVGKIKRGIRDQKPGGKKFDPLHPATIARKGSSKALIDDGDLINSITYRQEDMDLFVGVLKNAKDKEGNLLVNIAAVHEFGAEIGVTDKMRGFLHYIGIHLKPSTKIIRIPKRPFLGSTWAKEQETIYELIQEELQKELFGK